MPILLATSLAAGGNGPPGPSAGSASAAQAGKQAAEDKLHDLRQQLETLAAQQRDAEGERTDASRALREADGKVSQAARALHDTQAAIDEQQARLSELEAQQAALAVQLSKQRDQLAAIVRSAYALGDDEQLKLLLAQDRVADLARALAYHRYFEQDRLRHVKALASRLKVLADLTRQVDAQKAALASTRDEMKEQLRELEAQRTGRSRLVASIDASFHDRAERMAVMNRDAGELESLMAKLSVVMAHAPPAPMAHAHVAAPVTHPASNVIPAPTPGVTNGRFPWPLAGRLLADPGGDGGSGVLIQGHSGDEVRAIADGRVAFANWLKGYGLLVIVDHGNGLMSLYGNSETLLRNAGDPVHAGEAICTVGNSGGQAQNALYFEIRQNGKPVDARRFLQPR